MGKYRIYTAQTTFEDINGKVIKSEINEFRSFPLNYQRWAENKAYAENLNIIGIEIKIK
ncbi:hypothetical protein PM708P3_00007 [Parabacteroides phage PM708P3]|nr:hypothetical protein PM21P2_00029 [Parabacteroides phage PM21P2]WAX17729.1 hypothetical protein PM682P4_00017 [Parabacteroides phage PM682P4]WAX17789.1 hypothetical protein PM682P6_00028 [Parabacteroides phage PM682P6]WAX17830.1 hypothetical protein PM708P2_00020 [Parabacteroides phage PM708P2]WAX17865.1 hypothetical protein PM708P3_00007 [Parabacteroides phage PM708P3]